MEKVMSYFTGFFNGIVAIMIAIIPTTILWQLLTGSKVFEMDIYWVDCIDTCNVF